MTEYEQRKLGLINKVHRRDPSWKKRDLQGFSVKELRILLSSLRALPEDVAKRYRHHK